MKPKLLPTLILLGILCSSLASFGQLTGVKTIPGDYSTIAIAVSTLNASGVGAGGVTFNIAANYTETITGTISLTATGTVANPIVFQKDPGTSGANPLITAYTNGVGTPTTATQDGIWRLVGVQYVTINRIDLQGNPANTTNPSTMEYGYALYKANTSTGCQNVTIQNCVISLNPINNATGTAPMVDGSAGIIVMNATATAAATNLTPASVAGTNSNNKFYGNTIQNCNTGIALIGYVAPSPFTLADNNNDVGGSSAATGNTIINFGGGGAVSAAVGIRTLAQYGINISYNTINNNNGSGNNHANILRGILNNTATSASATISFNTITVNGGGTTHAVTAIENLAGSTPAGNSINIANNSILNSTYTTATSGAFTAILNSGAPATLQINNNTISANSSSATTGTFYGINNSGAATSTTINNNNFSGNLTGTSSGVFGAINNSAATGSLSILNNSITSNSTSTIAGLFSAIFNTGAIAGSINISNNNIGTSLLNAITYNAANTGAQVFINNTGGTSTASLTINNNDFQGITYASGGSGANTYISNSAATLSQTINNNTFTNLSIASTGSITFINNSVIVSATGIQTVSNNSVVTAFNKTGAGGTVTLFNSVATSVTGAVINHSYNNFSNITVTGSTILAGWVNTDAGNGSRTITDNTFSNWNGGTGAITVISSNITSSLNATTRNSINNITSAGNITCIASAVGNDNIHNNDINTIIATTTITATVYGILISGGTTKNIYQNNINNFRANNITTGTVRGILINGGSTVNCYQNQVFSFQAHALTTGTLSGIAVSAGTTVNANANKVYDLLSASNTISTGTVSGIQLSGAAANAVYTLSNNIIGNLGATAVSALNPVIGINCITTGANSSVNLYYNSVYLNASSTGTNFGSSAVSHTANATSTTGALTMANNIFINSSTANGSGLTTVIRRSAATLANYTNSSNNNLLYSGNPASNTLLYFDAVSSDQLLSSFKSRVSPRESASVTEDMISSNKFVSLDATNPDFLKPDAAKATLAESGGINVAGITTDYLATTRQGNVGYAGSGTAPDLGAFEINGIKLSPMSGIYYVGAGQTFTSLTRTGGLFAQVNNVGLKGDVVVYVTSDLSEDGANALYEWYEQGIGNYSLTIQPNSTGVKLINGDVVAGMIRFVGAKRVNIDGRVAGNGQFFNFQNTNNALTTGSAISFTSGASNNTVRNVLIEATTNATTGVVFFGISTTGGNSNNSIINAKINATVAGTTGLTGIYSAGTVGNENSNNSITNCEIFDFRDRAIDIPATGSTEWNIQQNNIYNGTIASTLTYAAASTLQFIRILGGAGYSITGNMIGGSSTAAGGAAAKYTSTGNLSLHGILLTSTGGSAISNIKSNTIANIDVNVVPTSVLTNVFIGIETNGTGINIGGTLAGEGNTIGSNNANGSIDISTATTSTTFTSTIRGINCNSTAGIIAGNQVGGVSITNAGASPAASTFTGIHVNNASTSQVSSNIIGSTGTGAASNSIQVATASAANRTILNGILLTSAVTNSIIVESNVIRNFSFLNTDITTIAAGGFIGISSAAPGTANVTISNNSILDNSIPNYSTGLFYGINTTGAATSLNITGNTLAGNSSQSATGLYYAVLNSGAVTGSINISGNNIGTASNGAFAFNAANSGNQVYLNNTAGNAAATITINNNNFQGINYNVAGTGTNTFISNTAATISQSVNGNTFTNLTLNTTGNVTFISGGAVVPASATRAVNNNSIITGFNKSGAGGILTLFSSTLSSGAGSVISNNNNNFSNITVNGNTTIAGWVNTDAGSGTKTIQGNSFSNWAGGTGLITVMNINITGTDNATSENTINNITGQANINGIITAAGNDNIYSNNISNISSTGTGATVVNGINVSGGTTKNIYLNNISALKADYSNLSGNVLNSLSVNGVLVSAGTTVNIYQNNISALTGDAIDAGTVNGIAVSGAGTVNITRNKIFSLSSNSTNINAGGISGIMLFPATGNTTNIINNYIGDIKTPLSGNSDSYRGLTINNITASNVNAYYNTIYLDGTSTGNNFGSTGIYHASSTNAAIGRLDLRNNIIVNASTPTGTGLTVVLRKYAISTNNYAATSDNNLFYAGVPGGSRVIYNDNTNSDQTLATFQARLVNREGLSVTENLSDKILSFNTASANYLHIDFTKCTRVESGGVAIDGITNDFDNDIRFGNTGYTGNGTAPDIGADEFNGITYPKAVLSGSTTICNGSAASLTLTVTGSGTISGTLSDGTPFSGTAPTIIVNVSPSVTTNYTIATLTNGSCAAETNDKTGNALVTVNARPTGIISGTQTICAGNAATLTLTVSGTGTISGTLSDGAAFSGTAPTILVNVSPATTTVYTIATLTNGTCAAIAADKTGSATVTVLNPSNATIVYNGSPYCSTGGTAAVTLTGTTGGTFSAPAGVLINSSTGAINLTGSSIGTYTITYTVPATGGCSPFVTTTSISIATPGSWTGAINNDWNNAGNWLCGAVPNSTVNASIAGGLTNYPILSSGTGAVNNISIASGATVNISNATLVISGNISNAGLFISQLGTLEMAGTSGQSIPAAAFQDSSLYALVINNSSVAGVSLEGQLDILESLTFKGDGRTFKTNDLLTLKSSALRTAWVGNTTNNNITGKVTVERYLSSRKGWRLLSIPTNTTQTILEAWQEGCNPNEDCWKGYGTTISGSAGTSAGFDVASATPSLKYYVASSASFVGVPNTNTTEIKNNIGYFIFVRGDRGATTFTSPVTSTILRTKGDLYTGDQPAITIPASKFASIGNPYAAPLDMRSIQKTNIKDFFYVWDPLLAGSLGYGAYQTFSNNDSGNYVITPGGGSYGAAGSVNNYIQSGQAFFVESTDSVGSIRVTESAKDIGSSLVGRNTGVPLAELRTNLLGVNKDGSTYIADGVLVNYDDEFSNKVDANDALKSLNTSENISIKTANKLLVIERKHNITNNDTVYLNIANMRLQQYRLEIKTARLYQPGISAMVIDNYLQTSTQVNIDGTTIVNFTITSAAASYAANRFKIVFSKLTVLPVTITSLQASYKQPKVNLVWKVENEINIKSYEIERSTNGTNFTFLNATASTTNGNSSRSYESIDLQPANGLNYYRVKSIDNNGQFAYSQIVKVQAGGITKSDISIFPNPIEAGLINVNLVNEEAGKYKIRVLNAAGQAVLLKEFTISQGSSVQTIKLDDATASGLYHVEITKPTMKKTTIDVLKW